LRRFIFVRSRTFEASTYISLSSTHKSDSTSITRNTVSFQIAFSQKNRSLHGTTD